MGSQFNRGRRLISAFVPALALVARVARAYELVINLTTR